jgi:hypothetical protein
MFCPYSGYMLEFDSVRGVAHCPQTGYTKKLEGRQLQLLLKADIHQ